MLFRLLFRKTIKNYESQISEIRKETFGLKENIEKLEKEVKNSKVIIKRIQNLLNRKAKDGWYCLLEYTKKEILVLTFIKKNINEIDIEVFNLNDEYYSHYNVIQLQANKTSENTEVYLSNIQGGRSQGHGELVMNHLLEYCKEEKINAIHGIIGSGDYGHIERLKSFYGKFGFEVTANDEQKNGSFRKVLK